MVSLYGYNEITDYRYMYDIADTQGSKGKSESTAGTILGLIDGNKDLTNLAYLVRLAKLDGVLNDPQSRITLFAPSDAFVGNKYNFKGMDQYFARQIIQYATSPRMIPKVLLSDNPCYYLSSKIPGLTILVENINGKTILNGKINIISPDIHCSNGIIKIVDDILLPSTGFYN